MNQLPLVVACQYTRTQFGSEIQFKVMPVFIVSLPVHAMEADGIQPSCTLTHACCLLGTALPLNSRSALLAIGMVHSRHAGLPDRKTCMHSLLWQVLIEHVVCVIANICINMWVAAWADHICRVVVMFLHS